ncbi:MAG: MmgE/PrpD family protein, partial [Solirubrobacteraceae bacterium]
MSTAAERLASFSCGLSDEQIPPSVQGAAKLHLLDTLGCGLAAHALDTAPAPREAMVELGEGGPATAIGVDTGMSPSAAALVNGATCHALD